jgi:hypothetical protein
MKKILKNLDIPHLGIIGFIGFVLLIAYAFTTNNNHKCVHDFTRLEDSVIKIQKYQFDGQDGYYPVGRKNGAMLVCIKCYYKTPQILDYGNVNKDISRKKK